MGRLITYPVQVQQLADQQQRIVDSNNATKIFNYEELVREDNDFNGKKIVNPRGTPQPPTLTKFDPAAYMALFMADDEAAAADASEGKSGEHEYDNLDSCFTPYVYVPSAAPVPVEPIQPKNPLGVMLDDDLGIFDRAIGDKLPVGSKFTMMGTDYVLTSFGGQIGGKRLFWVRQG